MSELSIFHGALEIADPQARSAYLDQACAGDAALRQRVEDLLQAHLKTTPFMSRPAPELLGVGAETAGGEAGAVIAGRYTLLERIGEGGMGEVWVAQQTEPVNRRVAVKLIKAGMDSKAVVTRFEAERQALALMDHPNIAKVFDGGVTDRDRPFFVMELVNGLPLTRFCDEAKLTPRERLELFVPVCQAVQHAHQKGIVHRDLKPSNVLVTLYDGRPVPKVIDFGVAKATGGKLTDSTLSTQFGAVVGTLEYMAPEQAGFSALDVDTRADIYSLGVILYEILTGLKPFDTARLHKAALAEVLRIIREEEPPRPSTRLSTDDALPSLAAVRQTEPKRLTALMRGELDWVVMKCLEKDRGRRYETANALSREIQRFLADEPVEARSPSARYRLRKFVRRNRGPVLAASVVLAVLVGGIVGTTAGLFEAKRQEGLARSAAEEEKKANSQAQKRLAQLEKNNEITWSIFDNIDPKEIAKKERPLQAILVEKVDKAVEQLEGESIGNPLVVAAMQFKFGKSLTNLGEPVKAIVVLKKALATFDDHLGPDHPETLSAMNNLGLAHRDDGKFDRALPLLEESLKRMKARLGLEHPYTLTGINNLALAYRDAGKRELAPPLLEEALKLRKAQLGPDHPDTLVTMNNLALAHRAVGRLDLALPLLEEAHRVMKAKLGPDHPDTLTAANNLAVQYRAIGKKDQALPLLEEAHRVMKAKLGPDHPDTLKAMANLGVAYREAAKRDLARSLLEDALRLMRDKLGADHPDTLNVMNQLAGVYHAAGKRDLALPLLVESLKLRKSKLGLDHPDTIIGMSDLGTAYRDAGRLEQALPLLEEANRLTISKLGDDHPNSLNIANNLAMAYRDAGNLDLAVPILEETLRRRKANLGADHSDTLISMNNLGTAYREGGKRDQAISLLVETVPLVKTRFGHDHPITFTAMNNLAGAYLDAGKLDQARAQFEEVLQLRKAKLGADHPDTLNSMNNVGMAYRTAGNPDLAVPLLEETVSLMKAKLGREHPTTFAAMNNLAGAYLDVGRRDDARPLVNDLLAEARRSRRPQFAGQLAALGRALLKVMAFAEAEPVLREALSIGEKLPVDEWTKFDAQSMLGGALLGQKEYAKAKPVLEEGYRGMKDRESKIPAKGRPRLIEAVDRLIELYIALDDPDEASKWRAVRASYPELAPPPRVKKP